MTVRIAASSSGGAHTQPIFQPVTLNVLPALLTVIVRSRMPGSVAIGTCSRAVEDQVLVHLVGEHEQVVLLRERRRCVSSSPRVKTLPVGLCGVLRRSSLGGRA